VAEGGLSARRWAALAVAGGAVAAELAVPAGSTPYAVLDATVAVAYALGAALARGRTADLALAVGAAWILGTLDPSADPLLLLHRAPLALLILTFPGARLWAPAGRAALAVAALAAPFAGATGTAAVLAAVALVAAKDARGAPAALRAPRAAAAVAGVAIAATAGVAAAGLGDPTTVLVVYELVLIATAAGLLGARWSAAGGLVVELGAAPAGAPVTARLAEALRDPSLALRLRLADGGWTDEAGQPAPDPAADGGRRALLRRRLDDGTEFALLHDPAAVPDRAAAESAVAVAATAVDNARRDRELRAQIEQLRRLRRGLLDAADEERRQLELELRSGPLREAEELERLLSDVPEAAPLRDELARARAELADIARGLYPLEAGLPAALEEAAARSPVPVALGLDDVALAPPVALTAYYVATEALANVVKHAGADSVRIELRAADGHAVLRIADDGAGGADPAGGGLSGLRERVRAVDGELRVHSPPGAGTVVEARLPR
jgi:signal transduction histidine kinase